MNRIINRLMNAFVALSLTLGVYFSAGVASAAGTVGAPMAATANIYFVSMAGNDANPGTSSAPFKTIQKAATKAVAGDTINLLAGSYTGTATITLKGTPGAPISITGSGAVFDGGSLILKNSEWLVLQGLTFRNATDEITVLSSHYLVLKNNIFDFTHTGIYIKDYSSHLVIENNEFSQSCALGKTWTQLKGSACEGGAVYGSSFGGGTYHIRNNWVHDVFNGFLFTDDSAGKWMNSNVFIYGNRFERVVDDPAEPEGDSFNIHIYGNTMIDTHRMVSLTTSGLGPVFVYNNVQITKGNPTNEATRPNSAFKIDMSNGYTGGAWIFNNTVVGDNAANFSAFDMLSSRVASPLTVCNNIYITTLKAFNEIPSAGSFDYDMSKAAFGMTQAHGMLGDALVLADGKLSSNSPAIGRSTQLSIPSWFTSSVVVSAGANLGAFQSIPAPLWVLPPEYPSQIPANMAGWPDAVVVIPATLSPVTPTATIATQAPTEIPTLIFTPTPAPLTATPSASPAPELPTATATVTMPTVGATASLVPESPTVTASPMPVEPIITLTSAPLLLEKIYDDKDGAFVYSAGWEDVSKRQSYNGSFKLTTQKDAFVTFTFTGQSFSVLYKGGPAFRKMDVYVDDVLVATIDEKTASSSFQQRWDYGGQLAQGNHRLKLVFVTPNKSNKTSGSVDAVIVR